MGGRMYNSIYEQRKRMGNDYHISLTLPREAYRSLFGEANKEQAEVLVKEYLVYKEDDGRPKNVQVFDYPDSNLINIESDLSYLGNEHTDY